MENKMEGKRIQQRTIESRGRIDNAAKELFTEKGYSNTNTKEIAKRAGVSVGNFYNYYKDKGEVYIQLVEQYLAGSLQAMYDITKEMKQEKNPRKVFSRYIHVQMERAKKVGNFFADSDLIIRESETLQQIFQKAEAELIGIIEDLLGSMEGVIHRASYTVMARLVYTIINQTTMDVIACYGTSVYEEYLEQLIQVIQNYLFGEEGQL